MNENDTWKRGKWVESPAQRTADPETGVEYDVLTGGVGNNTHVYFNRANFTGDGGMSITSVTARGNPPQSAGSTPSAARRRS